MSALDLEGKVGYLKAITLDTDENFDGLYVGASGNISIIPIKNSAAVVLPNVPIGWHPIVFKQITTANTTVANPTTNLIGTRKFKP